MTTDTTPTQERIDTDDHPTSDDAWRLRYSVGDLVHRTEWTTDFATVENLYEQYRRSDAHPGHDYTIERRAAVRDGDAPTKRGGGV